MSSLHAFYLDKIETCTDRIRQLRTKRNNISFFRLLVFVALVFSVYQLITHFSFPILWGAIGLLALFIILVNIYFQLKERQALWEKLLWVNVNEEAQLKDQPNGFPNGAEWLGPEGYLDDLDIFGPSSVFHYLNRTTTGHGASALASLLRSSLLSEDGIRLEQQAVRALSEQADIRQRLTAQGLLSAGRAGKGDLRSLGSWLATSSRLHGRKGIIWTCRVLVVFNMGSLFYYLSSDNYIPLVAGILTCWAYTGYFHKYISQQHLLVGKQQAILDQYAGILSIFNTAQTQDSLRLQELRLRTGQAHQAIRRLSRLTSFLDQRLNLLVNSCLNGLILYEMHCMISLEKWKAINKSFFPGWIDAVGSIERLNSLATFAFNNPDYAYPTPVGGSQPVVDATEMAHPLINVRERITNELSAGSNEKLILVTGSNMSGKTTFLRTLGVNLLLAQCGAPVCAGSFSFTPMQLLTSLRISDSLQEHTSYFMAELIKLQKIIHQLRTGLPALVLIDEILRGTNSEDKTYGSEQFIRRLIAYPCLSLFATHDLSLGQMEKEMPELIANYCFESTIENGNLHFDYKLQRGIARNRNASFLMKKMEII